MTMEGKGEPASVNRIEGTKRGHGKRNQSRGTKPVVRGLVTDLVEPVISIKRSIVSAMWAGRTFSRAAQDNH